MSENLVVKERHHFDTIEEANEYLRNLKTQKSGHWVSVPAEVTYKVSAEASILYGYILGFSNTGYFGSNTLLSKMLNCSSRTISRLMNELIEKECIEVVVVSKTRRLIYPLYTMPFVYDIDPSFGAKGTKTLSKVKNNPIDQPNGGFKSL